MDKGECKVLVVDDDLASLTLSTQTLKRAGYTQVEQYISPKDAKDALMKRPFDLLLLDIRMPEVSGFDLLEALQHVDYQHKTIVLTAQVEEKTRSHATNLGADVVMYKPYSINDLVDTIENVLV